MSPAPKRVKVRIRGIPVLLPVHIDEETTAALVQEVEDRFKRIEDESDTVDTQRFALQTAYEYAIELYEMEARQKQDTNDLVKVLERIVQELKDLTKRFHLPPPEPPLEE